MPPDNCCIEVNKGSFSYTRTTITAREHDLRWGMSRKGHRKGVGACMATINIVVAGFKPATTNKG
ncbi:MAG: hypothetical protein AABY38_00570 [Planctomycetota bacterium]